MIAYALIVLLLLVVDRVLKSLMTFWLADGPIMVIEKVVQFRYVENTGAAFGMFSSATLVLTILTSVVLLVLLYLVLFGKNISKFTRFSLAVVAAGGFGNLYDRVFHGFVVDFIEPLFVNFAVFNFADICITLGCIALLISVLFEKKHESEKRSADNA